MSEIVKVKERMKKRKKEKRKEKDGFIKIEAGSRLFCRVCCDLM
jgi:hypothetical protein